MKLRMCYRKMNIVRQCLMKSPMEMDILRTLREKTTKQARRIVLNLNDYPVEKRTELIEFIKSQTNKDLKHLDELLIIEDRQVTRAYWRFE